MLFRAAFISSLVLAATAGAEAEIVQISVNVSGRIKINGTVAANRVELEAKLEALCNARPRPKINVVPDQDAYNKTGPLLNMLQRYGCNPDIVFRHMP